MVCPDHIAIISPFADLENNEKGFSSSTSSSSRCATIKRDGEKMDMANRAEPEGEASGAHSYTLFQ